MYIYVYMYVYIYTCICMILKKSQMRAYWPSYKSDEMLISN